ncbi:sugar phosphate isomerase/epimerase family protein [Clavibacter tessellarius]|uniref:sugar phosphate isomerase/epimerase family protein n=1 Tax=Clavibacter tessellarius TaxID=31965 RepID=UPI0032495302
MDPREAAGGPAVTAPLNRSCRNAATPGLLPWGHGRPPGGRGRKAAHALRRQLLHVRPGPRGRHPDRARRRRPRGRLRRRPPGDLDRRARQRASSTTRSWSPRSAPGPTRAASCSRTTRSAPTSGAPTSTARSPGCTSTSAWRTSLGIPLLRHDVFAWPWREADDAEFERALATIVPVCRALADHAATLGIATTVENHGMSMNASDRILRLVEAVDRPAFRVTLDVGNSLCVDEDPLHAVPRLLPHAAVVHLKDFDVRDVPPDDTWMTTLRGRGIRGAVVGSGDLPLGELLGLVAASGFDGPVSIEFEGLEDPMTGFTQGLAAAQRLAAEAVR